MNEKGNRYALSALKDKRATLAGEIVLLKRQIRARQDALAHVDATIRLLDPGCKIDGIPPKRVVGRVRLFRQGELGRLILGALRKANQPLATAELVTAVLKAKGAPDAARPTLAPRVRTNLSYLDERDGLRVWRLL
jgi:hypothetical protein